LTVAKPNYIELPGSEKIAILYEDRSVMAIDKPRGWILAPVSWQRTARNLPAALIASIRARDFWARSRNLKFLRAVHRLDAETSGVVLLAKSPGAVEPYSALFESRNIEKIYLAVVQGVPREKEWRCCLKIAPEPGVPGRMKAHARHGKPAETAFRVLATGEGRCLVEASPRTGRTHQIRVHLAETGHPVVGDYLYGPSVHRREDPLGLRAIALSYRDPFTRRLVRIRAPARTFLQEFGFEDLPESGEYVYRD